MPVVFYLEIAAFASSIIFFRKIKNTPLVWFSILMFIVVLAEIIASELDHLDISAACVYNVVGIVGFLIWSWIYHRLNEAKMFDRAILLLTALGCLAFICGAVIDFPNSIKGFLNYSFGLISVILVCYGFMYLIEMSSNEKGSNIRQVMMFWISVGLLTYHLCNLPYTVFTNSLVQDSFLHRTLISIRDVSKAIMYILFIISFVCGNRKYNFS